MSTTFVPIGHGYAKEDDILSPAHAALPENMYHARRSNMGP
jgi:hypothetical protein